MTKPSFKKLTEVEVLLEHIKKCEIEQVKAMLQVNGKLVNECGPNKTYPLAYAAKYGRLDIMELIYKVPGLDMSKRNNFGETALHVAVQFRVVDRRVDAKHTLLRHNLKVDMVESLIKHGADVNAQDGKGLTPLMNCTKYLPNSCVRVAELLLDANANTKLKTHSGKTCFTMLTKHRQAEQANEMEQVALRNLEQEKEYQQRVEAVLEERRELIEQGERIILEAPIEFDDDEVEEPPKVTVAIELRELFRERGFDVYDGQQGQGDFSVRLAQIEKEEKELEDAKKEEERLCLRLRKYTPLAVTERWEQHKDVGRFEAKVPENFEHELQMTKQKQALVALVKAMAPKKMTLEDC